MTTEETTEEGAKVVDDAIGGAPESAEKHGEGIDDPEHPVEPLEPQDSPQPHRPSLYVPTRAITILIDPEGMRVGIIGTVTVEELHGAANALLQGAKQAMKQEAMKRKAQMDRAMGKGPGGIPNRIIV